jgi:acyl CoA:acetate/3-ketoacid CoA transferase
VGVFRLTERGLELVEVVPGVDVQRDILGVADARVVLPQDGKVETAPASVLTGEGFGLAWGQ